MVDQSSSKLSVNRSLSASLGSANPTKLRELLSKAMPRELAAIEADWKQTIRSSLLAWATEALAPAGHKPARHHRLLIDYLEKVARGDIRKLLVLCPPGSGKSSFVSQIFPCWWFCQHPLSSIIAVAAGQELADKFGRRVRSIVDEHSSTLGYTLDADNRAAGRWQTSQGGEFYASGLGGTITGRRADCIIIDDPVPSREDAESQSARDKTWAWYTSDLVSRLKPGGRIIVVQTRWNVDDLAGPLLQKEGWNVLCLRAQAEEDDPLGRAPGEWLWDDDPAYAYGKWLRERHEECVANGAERDWQSLFQQEPVLQSGNLFKVDCIPVITSCDNLEATRPVRAWDIAGTTKKSSDWTVGIRMHRLPSNRIIISDVVRLKAGPEGVERAIVQTAHRDGWATKVALARDPGQAGIAQIEHLTRALIGFEVISSPESGDKILRASPFASQCNVGNVSILDTGGDWARPLLNELRDFPAGKWDDQVDACSRAFATLGGSGLNYAMWEKLAEGPAFLPGSTEYAAQCIVDGRPPEQPARPPSAPPRPAAAPYVAGTAGLNRFGTS